MQDPDLPAGVKKQLADIPVRALREPELLAGLAKLFREAILAKEDALVAMTVQQSLLQVRAAMSIYGNQLVERIQRGMKVAFATSITHMLERSLWIVGLAVVIVLFVPEVPLRSRTTTGHLCRVAPPINLEYTSSCCCAAGLLSSLLLRFFGTFAPARRACDKPIAIACLRLVTLRPERPLRSVPRLRSCIARFTFCDAFLL